MQVRIWVGTDLVGSTIEDVIDLDDNLSDEECLFCAYQKRNKDIGFKIEEE